MVFLDEESVIKRRKAKVIKIGDKFIGGEYPILVQSMIKCDTGDIYSVVNEIKQLEKAGCDIVRVAVPDEEAAGKLSQIKKQINIPLVADIHFDGRLALKAIEEGVDKIRAGFKIIGSPQKLKIILKAAREKGIPVRIGVNAGSLDKDIISQYGTGVKAMIQSAMRYIKTCEDNDFFDLVISIKSSNTLETVKAYEELAEMICYPFHLGVTNAGSIWSATIKSALGIGSLLLKGIGDTIRVSLTGPAIEEVKIGWEILKSLDLRKRGVKIISCPTCGRLKMSEADFTNLVRSVEESLDFTDIEYTISIIGCAVNGPGEALKANLGVMIVDQGKAVLFRGDKTIGTVPISKIKDIIIKELFS